jgi:hypothetical protein
LLAPIASPPVSGFITYGRLAAPTLHNEAESGSLALRLTGSPREASPHGLLRLTLARLPAEWAIDRVSSFQLTRSARLILALHTLVCIYAPIDPSTDGEYRGGVWAGQGLPTSKARWHRHSCLCTMHGLRQPWAQARVPVPHQIRHVWLFSAWRKKKGPVALFRGRPGITHHPVLG